MATRTACGRCTARAWRTWGRTGQPIDVPAPTYGPDELLIRHDAIGLCFSDTKVIKQGPNHPRIGRDMVKEPVVLGHEVSLTVVGVGENLRDEYKVGDRFIVQAEINVKGFNMAYGYRLQGGLSGYNVIDQRILNGDDGNYLIPVQPATGYAESALTEPWACVTAAYSLKYRTGLKAGGTAWIVGGPTGQGQGSGVRGQGQFLHDQRWFRCSVTPCAIAADAGSGRVRGLAARTFGCPRHRRGGGR